MKQIINRLPFDKNDVDTQNYMVSLLKLCSFHKIIESTKILALKKQFDEIFKENARQYTKGESSSISLKSAEKLYSSIFYNCDVYLKNLKSVEKAVEVLKNSSAYEIYMCGMDLTAGVHKRSREVFKQAYKLRLDVPVYEYQYVMKKSFDEYNANYSARFDAENCCASIDYPLLHTAAYVMDSMGAVFIYEYYSAILCENEFCSCFNKFQIDSLLKNYGRIYGCKYSELLFNICEVILNNLFACCLLGKEKFNIDLSKEECNLLSQEYMLFSIQDISRKLLNSFNEYKSDFSNKTYEYLKSYITAFCINFLRSISSSNLNRMLSVNI